MASLISSFVDVKVVTWLKDTHGLFDYESKNIDVKRMRIYSSSNVYQDGGNIRIQSVKSSKSLKKSNSEQDYLFSIFEDKQNEDHYYLGSEAKTNAKDSTNFPFLVVRSIKDSHNIQTGYELECGDIIRLGRVEYRILEYQNDNSQRYSLFDNSVSNENTFNINMKNCILDHSKKNQCRICLLDEEDTDEILVNPCNCKGTSGYVHVQCLQNWIIMKMKKHINLNVRSVYWKKLNCEVCKASLPDIINAEGESIELVPLERPDSPYILLERLYCSQPEENIESNKTLILLNVLDPEASIRWGRGYESDIRENDISVSRLHALLKLNNGKFVIFDNYSKFGTLVRLRKNYNIEKRKIALQIGRTLIAVSKKRTLPIDIKPLHQILKERVARQQRKFDATIPEFDDNECSQREDINEEALE